MQELEYMTSCQQFRHGIKDLTNAMKSHSINNRNGHQIWQPLSVTGFDGPYRVVLILTLLKARLQHLITAARYAVSLQGSFHLSIRKQINNISLLLFKRRSKRISKHRLVTRKGLLHSNQDGEMFDDKYQANNIPAKRLTEAVHIGVPKPLIDSYCLNKYKLSTGYPQGIK